MSRNRKSRCAGAGRTGGHRAAARPRQRRCGVRRKTRPSDRSVPWLPPNPPPASVVRDTSARPQRRREFFQIGIEIRRLNLDRRKRSRAFFIRALHASRPDAPGVIHDPQCGDGMENAEAQRCRERRGMGEKSVAPQAHPAGEHFQVRQGSVTLRPLRLCASALKIPIPRLG